MQNTTHGGRTSGELRFLCWLGTVAIYHIYRESVAKNP
jgi:hypothetical protein